MAVLAVAAVGAAAGYGIATVAAGAAYASLGMSIGWAVGSYIGQMLFAPEQQFEGPRLSDLQAQASTDGSPLPLAYGTVRVPGRIIWATDIVETRHEEEVGGKGGFGGGGSTSITYTYSVSMACSLCEGPIIGIRRIWMDGKLVYSIAVGANPATFAANTARGSIVSYLGTETQTADPTVSAYVGASVTPAFRGTAYVVFANWQLADFANHIPMVECEVVVSGSESLPFYDFSHPASPTQLTSVHTLDTRRLVQYSTNHVVNAGDSIWRWDLNSSASTPFFTFDSTLAAFLSNAGGDISALVVHEAFNWIVIINEQLGTLRYAVIDGTSGALIMYAQVTITGTDLVGNSESVNTRDSWFYDPQEERLVSLGDGFNTADQYALYFEPQNRSVTTKVLADASSTAWNKIPLVDSQLRTWFVTSSHLILAVESPVVVTLPVAANVDGAFVWKARGEIWMQRASGHATDGWIVYDIDAETFSDSVDLFGTNTWTTEYTNGIENRDGNAWFVEVELDKTVTATQRNTSGVELKATAGAITAQGSGLRGLFYVPGVIIFHQEGGWLSAFYETGLEIGTADLGDVVANLCSRPGLTAIDKSALVGDPVRGFVVARPMASRNAIEPLQMAFGFDGVESDALIKFVKRGGASVVTIPQSDMAARSGGVDDEPIEDFIRTRALETELPETIHLRYINLATDYNIAAESVRRLTTQAVHTIETELPIVLTSQEAARLADNLLRQSWLERVRYSFFLGPKYSYLDPTDVVTLYDGTRVRLTRVAQDADGILSCEGSADDDGALTSFQTSSTSEWTGAITLPATSPTVLAVMDTCLLRDRDDDLGWYLGMCGEAADWTAGVAYESKDGGVSWVGTAAMSTASKIGFVVSGRLSDTVEPGVWDHESLLTVLLSQPDLTLSAPASLDAFYEGANAFFISTDRENWELAQAYTVTANADGSYTLQDFLRSRKGTEHSGGPFNTGAMVVFVDSTRTLRAAASLNELAGDYLWKGVTSGGNIADELSQSRTFDGVSAKPLAPVEIGGARQAGSGDIQINWTRRARKAADWGSGGAAPLDEDRETYKVEIWTEGYGTLLRTEAVNDVSTLTYTGAQIATDFGSPQPEYVSVSIAQYSERLGYGFPGRALVGNTPPVATFSDALITDNMELIDGHGLRRMHRSAVGAADFAPCSRVFPTGKWYWEFHVTAPVNITDYHGGITERLSFATGGGIGSTDMRLWRGNGTFVSHISVTGTGLDYTPTGLDHVFMFAWDADSGEIWAGFNGLWTFNTDPALGLNPNATHTPGGNWRPIVVSQVTGYEFTVDASFGRGNTHPIPTGFTLIQ